MASCASKLAGMMIELIAVACCMSSDVLSSKLVSCGVELARAVAALSLGDCCIRYCGGCCVRRSISAAFFPLVDKFCSCSLVMSAATVEEESSRVRSD